MKTSIPYSLILAAASCGLALGAETAYTVPVGYVSLGNPAAATDNVPAFTDVFVSIPVLKSASFAGLISAVGTDTLTVTTTPAFANDVWNVTPHVVVVESGAKSGLILPILSNIANQLTVGLGTYNLTGILANDKLSIRPAWTLSTFMSGASSLAGVQFLPFSNSQFAINNSPDSPYFFVGGNWENADGDPANNLVLYPGEGFIVRTTATPIAEFTVSGEVPVANSYVAIGQYDGGQRDSVFSYFTPVSEPLANSGLGFGAGDQLFDFDNTATGQNKSGVPYFFVSGNWENGDGDPAGTFPLQGGKAYLYRRAAATPTGDLFSQNQQAYVPSL